MILYALLAALFVLVAVAYAFVAGVRSGMRSMLPAQEYLEGQVRRLQNEKQAATGAPPAASSDS